MGVKPNASDVMHSIAFIYFNWSIMAQINLEEKHENQIAIESSNLIREVRDSFMRVSPGGKMENFPE